MTTTILVLIGLAALFVWWEFHRARRALTRADRALRAAWDEAVAAFRGRLEALEGFRHALKEAGLVPEGRRALESLLAEAASSPLDAGEIARLDEGIRTVLWRIFAALPRERPPTIRRAQDALAEAAEEFDIKRRYYNDLATRWNALLTRFPYRIVARGRFTSRELLPVRSEWELP